MQKEKLGQSWKTLEEYDTYEAKLEIKLQIDLLEEMSIDVCFQNPLA